MYQRKHRAPYSEAARLPWQAGLRLAENARGSGLVPFKQFFLGTCVMWHCPTS